MPAPFRIEIPSSRPGVKPYVIVRTEDGRIRHDHCTSWRIRHTCSHVDRAIELADRPAETFVRDACEVLDRTAQRGVGWWRLLHYARRGDEPCGEALDEILVGLFAGLHQARERLEQIDRHERWRGAREAAEARLAEPRDDAEVRRSGAVAVAELGRP